MSDESDRQVYAKAKSGVILPRNMPKPISGPVWVNSGERDEDSMRVVLIKKMPGQPIDWEKGERKLHGDPDPEPAAKKTA